MWEKKCGFKFFHVMMLRYYLCGAAYCLASATTTNRLTDLAYNSEQHFSFTRIQDDTAAAFVKTVKPIRLYKNNICSMFI